MPSCEVGCDGLSVLIVDVVVVDPDDLVWINRGRLLDFSCCEIRVAGPDSGTVCSTILPVPSDKIEPDENLLDIVGLGREELRTDGMIEVVVLLLRESAWGVFVDIAGDTSRDEVVAVLSTELVGE